MKKCLFLSVAAALALPAAGFALYLERVHVAQMEEESRKGEKR